jgi:alkylation response protein AidB-like acyl-CoA dehydrogenase
MSAADVLCPVRQAPAGYVADVDAYLGALAAAGGEFSTRHCAELDRAEAFPEQMCATLDALGVSAYYVPAQFGGALASYEDLVQLVRCVARRDLTVAVAHAKTFLGAAPVWVAGTPAQAVDLGCQIIGGARVSWALSEPAHGADLLASDVSARRGGGGYVIDGVKWPVNNATRGTHACLLARTDPAGGSRGFSLFLAEKASLSPGSYRNLPKARTHGIRGADISGIAFDGARLPESSLVAEPGSGIETVLLSLQLTRLMCAGLSLGAGEHALRLATEFAMTRMIQGRPLIDRPAIRAVLARSAALLLSAEAVTIVASRAVHALAGELSVISAVVKALLPTLIDGMIGELGELLGSRSFLDCEYADGAFAKLQRDHAIVAIFDGSTSVNRSSLIGQFPRLARGYAQRWHDEAGIARLAARPSAFDPRGLRLQSPGGCSIVQGLTAAADRVSGGHAASAAPGDGGACLGAAARSAAAAATDLHRRLAVVRPAARPAASAYSLAAEYELCFAAAACVQVWEAGHQAAAGSPLWSGALWARACLDELSARALHPGTGTYIGRLAPGEPGAATADQIADWLAGAVAAGAPITLRPALDHGRPS